MITSPLNSRAAFYAPLRRPRAWNTGPGARHNSLMLSIKLVAFVAACLLLQPVLRRPVPPAPTAQCQDRCKLCGRVVDSGGAPLAGASVTLWPGNGEAVAGQASRAVDLTFIEYKSDADGTFCIDETSAEPTEEATLFVTSPLPQNVYTPLTVYTFGYKQPRLFTGRRVPVEAWLGRELGDVPVNVSLRALTIVLQDAAGAPLRAVPDLKLRVRDEKGDILVENGVPTRAFNGAESAFMVALPQGVWGLEFGRGGGERAWRALWKGVVIDASRDPGQAVIRLRAEGEWSRPLPAVKSGSGGEQKEARSQLARLGIDYSPDSFVKRAAFGNLGAVRLFLVASMNPNARDRNGVTALMAAATYPEIEETLLVSGADVHLRSADGETALMYAALAGNVPSIQLLLGAGAVPNVRGNDGATPLILAAGNGHEGAVEALLHAGADPRPKDNNGLSALDYAKRSGDQRIVEMLERRPSRRPKR